MLVRQAPAFGNFNRHARTEDETRSGYSDTSSQNYQSQQRSLWPRQTASVTLPTDDDHRQVNFRWVKASDSRRAISAIQPRRSARRSPQLEADADGAGRNGAVGVTDGDLLGVGEVAGAGAWLVRRENTSTSIRSTPMTVGWSSIFFRSRSSP